MDRRITASELDRKMSELLSRVAYQGDSFIIERGGREVARLEPIGGPRRSVTAQEAGEKLRHLKVPEGLADDLEAIQKQAPSVGEPE